MSAAAATPAGAPASLAEIAARVERAIAAVLDAEADRWATVDGDLVAPVASLRALVAAGGKRLRPAFCHWAFVGLGGDPDDPRASAAGAALELLHTSALIHDDVIDASEVRHGIDAIHVDFARLHRRSGWRGDDARFGEGVAILVGNLSLVYAGRLLAGAPKEALDLFQEIALEVNVGQYLDLLGTARRDGSPAAARRVVRYKSAKYTVERPLHLGAALAAPDRLAQVQGPLSAYGLPLGEAFQLRDDILGTFGDPAVTGKPVGEDIREGKATVLYALARQRAASPAARLLRERFGAPDLSPEEVSAIQGVFTETGARAEVEGAIARLVDSSLAAVADLPVTAGARQALLELAVFVTGRNH